MKQTLEELRWFLQGNLPARGLHLKDLRQVNEEFIAVTDLGEFQGSTGGGIMRQIDEYKAKKPKELNEEDNSAEISEKVDEEEGTSPPVVSPV